jgi:hypothetical protein
MYVSFATYKDSVNLRAWNSVLKTLILTKVVTGKLHYEIILELQYYTVSKYPMAQSKKKTGHPQKRYAHQKTWKSQYRNKNLKRLQQKVKTL